MDKSALVHELISDAPTPGRYLDIGRHFTDDIFKCISINETFCILIEILLKFISKGPIHNNPALVLCDKPSSELRLTRFTNTYMRH